MHTAYTRVETNDPSAFAGVSWMQSVPRCLTERQNVIGKWGQWQVCRQTCQYLPFAKNFEPTQILLVSGLAWFIYIYQWKEKTKQIKTKQVAPSITKAKSNRKNNRKSNRKKRSNKQKQKQKKKKSSTCICNRFFISKTIALCAQQTSARRQKKRFTTWPAFLKV